MKGKFVFLPIKNLSCEEENIKAFLRKLNLVLTFDVS